MRTDTLRGSGAASRRKGGMSSACGWSATTRLRSAPRSASRPKRPTSSSSAAGSARRRTTGPARAWPSRPGVPSSRCRRRSRRSRARCARVASSHSPVIRGRARSRRAVAGSTTPSASRRAWRRCSKGRQCSSCRACRRRCTRCSRATWRLAWARGPRWRSAASGPAGITEPQVEGLLGAPMTAAGVRVGYYPHDGEVEVRLVARGPDAGSRVDAALDQATALLGPDGFSRGPIEAAVVDRLVAVGGTVGTAESLTGGLLAEMLTRVPGASEVFRGGFVTYAAAEKTARLGVDPGVDRGRGRRLRGRRASDGGGCPRGAGHVDGPCDHWRRGPRGGRRTRRDAAPAGHRLHRTRRRRCRDGRGAARARAALSCRHPSPHRGAGPGPPSPSPRLTRPAACGDSRFAGYDRRALPGGAAGSTSDFGSECRRFESYPGNAFSNRRATSPAGAHVVECVRLLGDGAHGQTPRVRPRRCRPCAVRAAPLPAGRETSSSTSTGGSPS